MGTYSTAQFIGIFAGGTVGGILLHQYQLPGLFLATIIVSVIWFLVLCTMKQPPYFSTVILPLPSQPLSTDFAHQLLHHPGVSDVSVSEREQLIYIKADKRIIDENELRKVLETDTLNTSN